MPSIIVLCSSNPSSLNEIVIKIPKPQPGHRKASKSSAQHPSLGAGGRTDPSLKKLKDTNKGLTSGNLLPLGQAFRFPFDYGFI